MGGHGQPAQAQQGKPGTHCSDSPHTVIVAATVGSAKKKKPGAGPGSDHVAERRQA